MTNRIIPSMTWGREAKNRRRGVTTALLIEDGRKEEGRVQSTIKNLDRTAQ